MVRWLLTSLRAVSIAMLAGLIIVLGFIANTDIFNVWEVLSVIGQVRDILSYSMYFVCYGLFIGLLYMVYFIFFLIPGFDAGYFFNFMTSIFFNLVGRWFYLPGVDVTAVSDISLVWTAFTETGSAIGTNFYMVILQLLVGLMFFFAIRASITSNPGDSIKTIVFYNLILIIPMFFIRFNEVLLLFMADTPPWLLEILNKGLLKESIYADISNNLLSFFGSPIFIVALFSFLYLEFVFQMSYVDQVTAPSIEREERLTNQIEILKVEAERALQNIKAIEEKKIEDRRLKLSLESMQQELEEKKRLSLRTFMSEKGSQSFTFVSELIDKKKREKEENRMLGAMRETRRLANYLDKLFNQDSEAKSTLTAKTSAPTNKNLVSSTILNVTFRLVLVTLLSYICIHPYQIFSLLNTPAIMESVEIQTYEGVLSLLIPILLLFPLISTIIKITKHGKLQESLRLEELKRAGLTEEEMRELEATRGKISQQEVQMARDQDAMAQNTPTTP